MKAIFLFRATSLYTSLYKSGAVNLSLSTNCTPEGYSESHVSERNMVGMPIWSHLLCTGTYRNGGALCRDRTGVTTYELRPITVTVVKRH